MDNSHNKLMEKSSSYSAWHQNKYHQKVQWLVLAIAILGFGSLIYIRYNHPEEAGLQASADSLNCTHYAAVDGSQFGLGTSSNPWDLQTALNQGSNLSGKVLCLKGGTYIGRYVSNLVSATVRSAPGEWAKLDAYVKTTLLTDLPDTTATTPCTFESLGNGITTGDPGGSVVIDKENILIFNPNGNTASCLRNRGGTIAVSAHAIGATATSLGDPFVINGSDTVYRDFEMYNSNPVRVYNDVNSTTGDSGHERGGDVHVYGPRTKLINLVIHDQEDGIYGAVSAVGSEFYGNIIYNNGLSDCVRGHGHGMYLQNEDTSQPKKVSETISFNNFSTGMKGFGVSGPAKGMQFDGVISFNNGSLEGFPGNCSNYPTNRRETNLFVGPGSQPASGIVVKNNMTYHRDDTFVGLGNVAMGWSGVRNLDLIFQDNYVAGGQSSLGIDYWSSATVTGNTIYGSRLTNPGADECLVSANLDTLTGITWDSNKYYDSHIVSGGYVYDYCLTITGAAITNASGGGKIPFAQPATQLGKGWKEWTNFDTNSTYTLGKPTQNKIFVRPNQYETGRANIAVYNWIGATNVSVNLSTSGLTDGQEYKIVKAENFFGTAIVTGKFSASNPVITLPVTDTTVAEPIGLEYTPTSTCPEFCVFVVLPTLSGGTTPPPSPSPTINSFTANPGTVTAGTSSSLSWNVTGATSLSIDQGVGDVTGKTSINVSPTATTKYTITAANSSGNSTATSTITVNPINTSDTSSPTVSIIAPTNNSTVAIKSTVAINVSASDNRAVTKVEIYIGATLLCTDTTAPYSCNWKVPAAKNRSYSINTKAYDAAGNIGSATVIVKTK